MNLAITRQRNLMQQAIRYYEDIRAIERNFCSVNALLDGFSISDPLVRLKVEQLQQQYAETVTELAKLLMETVTT